MHLFHPVVCNMPEATTVPLKKGGEEQSSISLVKVMFCALLSFGRTACVCAICEVP